jgi:uncharacterized integral membrane protein (TIGR00698 family)
MQMNTTRTAYKHLQNRKYFLIGILHVLVISLAAFAAAQINWMIAAAISPLIIGIIGGIALSPYYHHQEHLAQGINFCAKKLLRAGIILYGFRVSLNGILDLGIHGVLMAAIIVAGIFLLATYVGPKFFGLDRETSMLVGCGSAVCGAAAVMALESTLKSSSSKSSVALGTVIIYGLLAMFIYPIVYRLGLVPFNHYWEGFYAGGTIHEVANVVGAAGGVSPQTEEIGVVVKMIRVILLVPLLLIVSMTPMGRKGGKITIPWFALGFLLCIGLNAVLPLNAAMSHGLVLIDTLLLTMAMTALGMEMKLSKFREAGGRAFALGGFLFLVLIIGGAFLVWGISLLRF